MVRYLGPSVMLIKAKGNLTFFDSEEQKNLLKCYDNCPNIPERSTQEGTVTNICVAADQQRATMTTAAPKPTNTGDSTSEPTDDSSDSSTTSSSDAPAETTEAAADDAGSGAAGIAPMGIFGLLAGAAAVAAAF